MNEQVKYKVVLDGARESQKQLDDLSKSLKTGGGGANELAQSIGNLDKSFSGLREPINNLVPSLDAVTKSKRNLGQSALELGRAVEDLQYGLGGVINNLPGLLMGLGAGAGLIGVVQLGAVAVNQLVKEFSKVDPVAKEAADEAKKHMADLAKDVRELHRELATIRSSSAQVDVEDAEQLLKKIELAADRATGGLIDTFKELSGPNGNFTGLSRDKLNKYLALEEKTKENFEKSIPVMRDYFLALEKVQLLRGRVTREAIEQSGKEADQRTSDINKIVEEYNKEQDEKEKKAKKAQELFDKQEKENNERIERETKRINQLEQQRLDDVEKNARFQEAIQEKKMKDQLNREEEHLRNELHLKEFYQRAKKKFDKEEVEDQKQKAKEMGRIYQQYSGLVIGETQNYINAKINGEEEAELAMVASIMRVAGQQLIASGVSAFAHAGEHFSKGIPGIPEGVVALGIGTSLTAAGLTLGGVASGIDKGIADRANAKQEAIKSNEDNAAKKEKGLSPSRGGGDSNSGNLIVNVSYGAGGPMPEDIAREINKVVRQADRRAGR